MDDLGVTRDRPCIKWGAELQEEGAILGVVHPIEKHFGTRVSCSKTDEPVELPFLELTCVGPRNHVSDRDQNQTN